jgi:hypothetical protein
MATLSIEVPNDKVEALGQAIEAAWGRNEGESDSDMARRHVIAKLVKVYKWHQGQVAKANAEASAEMPITLTT